MSDTNIRLIYEFWTDGEDKMTGFTSESGNMYADNLGFGSPANLWRSAYTAPPEPIPTQDFIYDLGEDKAINCLFLYNLNLGYDALIEFTIATDALFSNIVFYEVWSAVDPIYGFGEGPFGLIPFGGFAEEKINLNYFVKYLSEVSIGRHLKISLSDPQNPSGYLQAGRLGVGQYFEPEYNVSWNQPLGLQTETKITIMRSGAKSVQEFPQARILTANFEFLSELDAYKFHLIKIKRGSSGQVFLSQYPHKNSTFGKMFSMLATITDFSGVSPNNPVFSSAAVTFHESL